jgi:16S rRNA (adenine1518-N6/adenine1519-N6)-dimethyltransferase
MRATREHPEISEVKERLRQLGVRATKGLGQHFLVDRGVLERIVEAADLDKGDTVLEIGPGLGVLTDDLVERADKVVAVEVDSILAAGLARRYSGRDNVAIVNADALDADPSSLRLGSHYKLLGNLPYYVASAILRHFLEAKLKPELIVVTLQREVAEAIVAGPGRMSLVSIAVQLYGKPSLVDYVPAKCFYPLPKVESAIIRIDVYPESAVRLKNVEGFFEIVKSGFSSPRKQIRNSLAVGLNVTTDESASFLKRADIDPTRRPQTLSLEEWARLYETHDGPILME